MSCPRGAEQRIQAVSVELTEGALDFLVQECKHYLIQKAKDEEKARAEPVDRFASPKMAPKRRTMDGSPVSEGPAPTVIETPSPSSAPGRSPRVKVTRHCCYYLRKRSSYMARIQRDNGKSSYKSFRIASPKSADRTKRAAKAAALAWIRQMSGQD